MPLSQGRLKKSAYDFKSVSGHLEAASVHSNGPYYDVYLVQLLNAAEYRESAVQGIRAGVIAVILSAGVLVFILSARLADRSLRGLARLKALLPALGLALLACLDVLWIVRLVNPGCG
ncbi:MAG TPA: hypothetical protein PKW33_09445 [Anaerolineaceae bacterium]|nr:hypothetical protein [Anaerolineaceae bacterium]HPN51800.1 hypothetical protein [Anaerolineaceae bacterium]